jgi:hypothetical protein
MWNLCADIVERSTVKRDRMYHGTTVFGHEVVRSTRHRICKSGEGGNSGVETWNGVGFYWFALVKSYCAKILDEV